MTSRPHDVVDLFLAPVLLEIDANLERLGGLDAVEVANSVELATNAAAQDGPARRAALISAATQLVDLHGWQVDMSDRGLVVSHGAHRVVLGLPRSVIDYLGS